MNDCVHGRLIELGRGGAILCGGMTRAVILPLLSLSLSMPAIVFSLLRI